MFSLKTIASSISLLVFLFFLSAQGILVSSGKYFTIVLGDNISLGGCAKLDIHCDKIDEKTYVCEQKSNLSVHQQVKLREIPVGHGFQLGGLMHSSFFISQFQIPQSLGENYSNPDPYILPFVKSIKILI